MIQLSLDTFDLAKIGETVSLRKIIGGGFDHICGVLGSNDLGDDKKCSYDVKLDDGHASWDGSTHECGVSDDEFDRRMDAQN